MNGNKLVLEYPNEFKGFILKKVKDLIPAEYRVDYDRITNDIVESLATTNTTEPDTHGLSLDFKCDKSRCENCFDGTNEKLYTNSIMIDITNGFKEHIQKLKAQQCPN